MINSVSYEFFGGEEGVETLADFSEPQVLIRVLSN